MAQEVSLPDFLSPSPLFLSQLIQFPHEVARSLVPDAQIFRISVELQLQPEGRIQVPDGPDHSGSIGICVVIGEPHRLLDKQTVYFDRVPRKPGFASTRKLPPQMFRVAVLACLGERLLHICLVEMDFDRQPGNCRSSRRRTLSKAMMRSHPVHRDRSRTVPVALSSLRYAPSAAPG